MQWKVGKEDAEAAINEVSLKRKADRKRKLLKRWGIPLDSDYADHAFGSKQKKKEEVPATLPAITDGGEGAQAMVHEGPMPSKIDGEGAKEDKV